MKQTNPWIPYRRTSAHTRLRLFCFPYAGGSAAVFRNWLNCFSPEIDVCPVQYPGREKRIVEPPFSSMSPLIDALAGALLPELDVPFAFFGHSLGALISFELSRRLQEKDLHPVHLFVSGYRAPTLARIKPPMHLLPDAEFIERLRTYNGTPEEVLQNSDLMNVLLPILRADFALHETYTYAAHMPLACPISALGGTEDPDVKYQDLAAWQEQTSGNFKILLFPGDHFYIHNNAAGLMEVISRAVKGYPIAI
ncbi:thioesterase II family protein [Acetonema longum]|uniref:Thioesterase n=1 Tax=Acetonema longum DSM 6540 TaxID=1009370 RepID=F7NDS2_9FIRM|nr:alpha/beta fold hydrolase [Acetonema longum]EGO65793.1 thioesterase [Acetonema longum DSM 6540]